jgi:hypothetical protein
MIASLPLLALTPPPSPDSLTIEETSRLRELERVIEEGMDGFLKVGAALIEIRDSRLYRSTHTRFADYCRDRWALSLSRCNQIMHSVEVFDHLTAAFPEDARVLSDTPESALRPLGRVEPELQIAAWELIKKIEARPNGKTIQEVVTTIRDAIEIGWEEQESEVTRRDSCSASSSNGRNRTTPHRTQQRQSDELGTLCRWANRIANWDVESIALADDESRIKSHLKAARQLRTFCEAFIAALETRLSN